jgi:hypothetical protein
MSNSEEAAEMVATIRGEHVVMKNWFMGPTKEAMELRDKYGAYPALWKEVLNWPGWKEARKAYLRFTDGGSKSADAPPPGTATSSSTNDETQIPRKRQSRWGSADEQSTNDADGQPAAQKQRRSRWGQDPAAPVVQGPAAPLPYMPPPAVPAPIMALPGLGLPGMPQNLTPQQQDEFRRHQARLKEVNSTLDNIDLEAARVDALPRGHRERSPSPPPGKNFVPHMFSRLLSPFVLTFLSCCSPDSLRRRREA